MTDRLPLSARCLIKAKRLLEQGGCCYTDDPEIEGRYAKRGLPTVERLIADQLALPVGQVREALRVRHFTPLAAVRWWEAEVGRKSCPIHPSEASKQQSRRHKAAMRRLAEQHSAAALPGGE